MIPFSQSKKIRESIVTLLVPLAPLIALFIYWVLFREPFDIVNRIVTTKYSDRSTDAQICRRTLKYLYKAFLMYTIDSNGYLPVVTDQRGWVSSIDYITWYNYPDRYRHLPGLEKQLYECPKYGRYLFNLEVSGKKLEKLPEKTIILRCPGVHDGIRNVINARGHIVRLPIGGKVHVDGT